MPTDLSPVPMEENDMPMKNAIWRKCNGEAHSNPHIDHCGVCMPWWGEYPLCPYCGTSPRRNSGGEKARCRGCGKYFTMKRGLEFLEPKPTSIFDGDGREKIEPVNALEKTRPVAVTRARAVEIIRFFEQEGRSVHSNQGGTMWVILTHCKEKNIVPLITGSPSDGYVITKTGG